jgi:hypothetical protein
MSENLNKNNVDDAFAKIFLGEVNIAENKQSEIKSQSTETEELKKIEVENEQERKTREEREENPEKSINQEQEERQKELLKADLKIEYESLKKQLNDAKSWGHKKNAAYINAKKKVTDFLSKLQEDSLINEDEASIALKAFDEQISEEEPQSNDKGNSYAQLKANLDKEFNIFKKYNKTSELDEKYQAFFGFFPLLPADEQEKIVNYITSESPEVVIDHIITTGSEIYETVYKGATKSGGIIPFIKSLHAKIEKLEKRNKELESEVDTTEGIVHNRSINSKVSNLASTKQTKNFADIWQN